MFSINEVNNSTHEQYMELAFREAGKALKKGEVPVGAVVVFEGHVIGRGHNLVDTLQDPTAHAEMIALTAAANTLASWRLDDTSLYVTLEPCPMCTGAIVLCRIELLVFAAKDSRWGACGSALNIPDTDGINSSLKIKSGIMADRSTSILQSFFEKVRNNRKHAE